MAIKKTKLKKPYNENGKTNFKIRHKAGVYLIFKAGEIRYIGFSRTDVYKALYRHFQTWKDPIQQRITYKNIKGIKVRVVYCNTPKDADRLEKALIIKMQPPDNIDKYWINNETDEKENKIYSEYLAEDTSKVIINDFKSPLPF